MWGNGGLSLLMWFKLASLIPLLVDDNTCQWKKFNVDIEIFSAHAREGFQTPSVLYHRRYLKGPPHLPTAANGCRITFLFLMTATVYLSRKLVNLCSHKSSSPTVCCGKRDSHITQQFLSRADDSVDTTIISITWFTRYQAHRKDIR